MVYDKTGEFVEAYYREGYDYIINPFDTRTEVWNIFKDFDRFTYDQLATLIPSSSSEQQFWTDSARKLLRTIIEESNSTDEILYYLDGAPLPALMKMMMMAGQAGMVSNETTFGSIRSTAGGVGCSDFFLMQPNIRKGDKDGFSINEYLAEKDDRWIFLSVNSSHMLKQVNYISLFYNTLVERVLSLTPDKERKLWLVLDELPSLPPMDSIVTALAEGRKYGLVVLAGVQQMSQLKAKYKDERATTLWGLFATRLYLGTKEAESAEAMSKDIGEVKLMRKNVSKSESASGSTFFPDKNATQPTSSTSYEYKSQPAVMPSQIIGLTPLNGYLLLSESEHGHTTHDVYLVRLSPEGLSRAKVPGFILKEASFFRTPREAIQAALQKNPDLMHAVAKSVAS